MPKKVIEKVYFPNSVHIYRLKSDVYDNISSIDAVKKYILDYYGVTSKVHFLGFGQYSAVEFPDMELGVEIL